MEGGRKTREGGCDPLGHLDLEAALVPDDDVVGDPLGVEGLGHPHRQGQGAGLRARVTNLRQHSIHIFVINRKEIKICKIFVLNIL